MWLSASWGKSTVFCLMNLLKPQLVSPLTPGESGIIRDANRSAFCLSERRGKHFLCAGTWANVKVFNINSLSSRTQLGHLCLTHSIGSKWIWIYGPMEGATGWITKWDLLQAQQNGGCTTWQSGTDASYVVWMYKKDETKCIISSPISNSLPTASCVFIWISIHTNTRIKEPTFLSFAWSMTPRKLGHYLYISLFLYPTRNV